MINSFSFRSLKNFKEFLCAFLGTLSYIFNIKYSKCVYLEKSLYNKAY